MYKRFLLAGLIFLAWIVLFTLRAALLPLPGGVGFFVNFVMFTILFLTYVRFTFVNETTAKMVMRLNGFKWAIMQWDGHRFNRRLNWSLFGNEYDLVDKDKDPWEVIKGKEPLSIFGGLRFAGFWPFDQIYVYNFRWRGVKLKKGDNGNDNVEFYEKELDYIYLRPDVYPVQIENAETKAVAIGEEVAERISLEAVRTLLTMRSINPVKTLFQAPDNWFENVNTRFGAAVRTWISRHTLDEILEVQSDPQKVWAAFEAMPLLTTTLPAWGIAPEENGIEFKDIDLPENIKRAAAAEKEQQLLSRGAAAETTGRLFAMIETLSGKKKEALRAEFDLDPDGFLKKHERLLDLVRRKMGVGPGIQEIIAKDAGGLLLEVASRLGGAGKPIPSSDKTESGGKKKKKKKDSDSDDNDDDDDDDLKKKIQGSLDS